MINFNSLRYFNLVFLLLVSACLHKNVSLVEEVSESEQNAQNQIAEASDIKVEEAYRLLARKSYVDSQEAFEEALTIDSSNANAYFGLGEVFFATDTFVQARDYCKRALEMSDDPEVKVKAGFCIADTYEKEKNWRKARETYREILKLDGRNRRAREGMNNLHGLD